MRYLLLLLCLLVFIGCDIEEAQEEFQDICFNKYWHIVDNININNDFVWSKINLGSDRIELNGEVIIVSWFTRDEVLYYTIKNSSEHKGIPYYLDGDTLSLIFMEDDTITVEYYDPFKS